VISERLEASSSVELLCVVAAAFAAWSRRPPAREGPLARLTIGVVKYSEVYTCCLVRLSTENTIDVVNHFVGRFLRLVKILALDSDSY
jgi:hypothetical protein